MMAAATWLLSKFGLTLLEGKTLMPIAAFIAACVAAVALVAYIAHSLTAAGYDKAVAECKATNVEATLQAADHQTQLREASREVIIKHTAASEQLKAAAANERKEVTDDAKTNPAPAGCALTAAGLGMWNRPLLNQDRAAPVPGGSIADYERRFSFTESAALDSGRSGQPAGKPDGLKASLFGSVPLGARALRSSQAVPATPETSAAVGTR